MAAGDREWINGLSYLQEVAGKSFAGADLASVHPEQARFVRCDFSGADLRLATLERCSFRSCDFSRAMLNSASLRGALFAGCDLTVVDWPGLE